LGDEGFYWFGDKVAQHVRVKFFEEVTGMLCAEASQVTIFEEEVYS